MRKSKKAQEITPAPGQFDLLTGQTLKDERPGALEMLAAADEVALDCPALNVGEKYPAPTLAAGGSLRIWEQQEKQERPAPVEKTKKQQEEQEKTKLRNQIKVMARVAKKLKAAEKQEKKAPALIEKAPEKEEKKAAPAPAEKTKEKAPAPASEKPKTKKQQEQEEREKKKAELQEKIKKSMAEIVTELKPLKIGVNKVLNWLWFDDLPENVDVCDFKAIMCKYGGVHWACGKNCFCWHHPEDTRGVHAGKEVDMVKIVDKYGFIKIA